MRENNRKINPHIESLTLKLLSPHPKNIVFRRPVSENWRYATHRLPSRTSRFDGLSVRDATGSSPARFYSDSGSGS